MDNDLFLAFIAFWGVFVLLPCYLAGSTWIARANQQIEEGDRSGLESSYPTA